MRRIWRYFDYFLFFKDVSEVNPMPQKYIATAQAWWLSNVKHQISVTTLSSRKPANPWHFSAREDLAFFQEMLCSMAPLPKSVSKNLPTLTEKKVPKQYPWGAISTISTLFFWGVLFSLIIMFVRKKTPLCIGVKTAPLCRWGAKTVPLGAPNYGQPNSTPRSAVSAPFFSECIIWNSYLITILIFGLKQLSHPTLSAREKLVSRK